MDKFYPKKYCEYVKNTKDPHAGKTIVFYSEKNTKHIHENFWKDYKHSPNCSNCKKKAAE